MFLPSEDLETTEAMPPQGLNPKENALLDLRRVCDGLFKDFGSIRMGMALHSLVEKQRDKCFKLGNTVQAVNEVIESSS